MSSEKICSEKCSCNSCPSDFMGSYKLVFFYQLDELYGDMEDLLILCYKSICKRNSEYKFEFDLYYLDIELSAKIKSYETQQFSNNMCEEEKILISQLEELRVEGQLLDYTVIDVVTVEKSALELCNEVDNIIFKNSSMCKYEDVKNNAIHKLGRIGPHSNHFSTLCLDDEKLIEPSEPIEECMEEEQCVYILEFIVPRSENYIPHLGSKKCIMQYLLLGTFIFIPPPLDRNRKIDSKLGVQFISSKWKEK